MKGGEIMASRENGNSFGSYDALLDKAVVAAYQAAKCSESKVSGQTLIPIADDLGDGAKLVVGNFPYPERYRDVPGRVLTGRITKQPVCALVEDSQVTPLAYGEDVVGLRQPLAAEVVSRLEILGERRITA